MRVSRIAAIALLTTAGLGTSAAAAYASGDDNGSGEVESSPHAVHPGQTIRFSTEACQGTEPARVHVIIDGVRHRIWLNTQTSEGATGWFVVPKDTDPGVYEVEGRCDDGPSVEGTFVVKHHHHHHVED